MRFAALVILSLLLPACGSIVAATDAGANDAPAPADAATDSGIDLDASLAFCDPDPCLNDGRCVEGVGDFLCECDGSWGGDVCDSCDDTVAEICAEAGGTYTGARCFCCIPGGNQVMACEQGQGGTFNDVTCECDL